MRVPRVSRWTFVESYESGSRVKLGHGCGPPFQCLPESRARLHGWGADRRSAIHEVTHAVAPAGTSTTSEGVQRSVRRGQIGHWSEGGQSLPYETRTR